MTPRFSTTSVSPISIQVIMLLITNISPDLLRYRPAGVTQPLCWALSPWWCPAELYPMQCCAATGRKQQG